MATFSEYCIHFPAFEFIISLSLHLSAILPWCILLLICRVPEPITLSEMLFRKVQHFQIQPQQSFLFKTLVQALLWPCSQIKPINLRDGNHKAESKIANEQFRIVLLLRFPNPISVQRRLVLNLVTTGILPRQTVSPPCYKEKTNNVTNIELLRDKSRSNLLYQKSVLSTRSLNLTWTLTIRKWHY